MTFVINPTISPQAVIDLREAVGWSHLDRRNLRKMITVVKQDPRGKAKLRYQGEIAESLPDKIIIQAIWTHPSRDLGYIQFEPGDCFTEYFYTDRWFNIFEITSAAGTRKGWYCNVTEPAVIFDHRVEQIDLILDVWVSPDGKALILDEDEFAADSTLSDEQRERARQGLQAILQLLETRQEMFSGITEKDK